jgi:nucleotide-binding universal stress UspA family protein
VAEARPYVVVGADGSPASVEALKWALRYASLIGGEVRVVTGYTYPFTIFLAPTYTEADYERDAAEALLVTVEHATLTSPEVPMTTTVMEVKPGRLLTEMSRGAAALVVGAHGQGEFPGMHLGSVANYCAHHAECPVVVMHSPPAA